MAIECELMAWFAVQTSDFQAEILRQQQQKQEIAKRKRMVASKSRYPLELPLLTRMTASYSIKQTCNWFEGIAEFRFPFLNQTLLQSQ